jgi:hypothetical protein
LKVLECDAGEGSWAECVKENEKKYYTEDKNILLTRKRMVKMLELEEEALDCTLCRTWV